MKQIQQYFYFLVKLADYTGESWEWKKKKSVISYRNDSTYFH